MSQLMLSPSNQNALPPTLSYLVKLLLTSDTQLRCYLLHKGFPELLPSQPSPSHPTQLLLRFHKAVCLSCDTSTLPVDSWDAELIVLSSSSPFQTVNSLRQACFYSSSCASPLTHCRRSTCIQSRSTQHPETCQFPQ